MFSEIVYRGNGPHQRKGGGFSTLGVKSEGELERALAEGWYRTLPEAIEAHDNPKPIIPEPSPTEELPADPPEIPPQAPIDPPQIEPIAPHDPLDHDGDGKRGGSLPRDDGDPVTREELETNAKRLGIKFDGRTSNAKLLKKITEALKRGL